MCDNQSEAAKIKSFGYVEGWKGLQADQQLVVETVVVVAVANKQHITYNNNNSIGSKLDQSQTIDKILPPCFGPNTVCRLVTDAFK